MSTVQIRNATPADAGLVHQLISELAAYERESHSVKSTVNQLQADMASENPPFHCLIAEDKSVPVGFVLYFFAFSTWTGRRSLWMEDLYVRQSSRGTGAGIALMRRVAELALQHDCGRVEWSVLDWNQPAIDFYDQLGALPQTGWTRYRMTLPQIQSLVAKAAIAGSIK